MQRPAKPWTPVRFRPQPPSISRLYYDGHLAGVAELVDATDLRLLGALWETGDVELLKFGEPCQMAIPSQAR